MRVSKIAAFATCFCVLACSGASPAAAPVTPSSASSTAPPPESSQSSTTAIDPAVAQFVDALIAATCENIARCPDQMLPFLTMRPLLSADATLCQRTLHADRKATLYQSLESGRRRFDPARAEATLAALRQSCGSLTQHELEAAFVGTVAENGMCATQEECATGLSCDANEETCPGVCRRPTGTVALGAECQSDADCRRDAPTDRVTCAAVGTPPRALCASVAERHDTPARAPCGRIAPEGGPVTYAACAAGLFCKMRDVMTDTVGQCAAAIAVGRACRTGPFGMGDVCEAGAACVSPHNSDSGVCTRVVWVADENAACSTTGREVRLCNPYAGLECQNGTCLRVTGEGLPRCVNEVSYRGFTIDATDCGESAYCDATTSAEASVCRPRAQNGAPCHGPALCLSHYCTPAGVCADEPIRCN